MNLFGRFSALVRHYVSPAFVTLFCASFVLWYIVKLDHTYTAEYAVHVNIDGERLRVPCVVEGKGATLFGYRVYMQRQIRIPLSELKYTVEQQVVEPENEDEDPTVGEPYCILDPQSLHNAISVRCSDIKVISVGNIPPLPMPEVDEKAEKAEDAKDAKAKAGDGKKRTTAKKK